MNKIHNIFKAFVAITISAIMVCSCDNTANDIKVEAINGHYDGTVIVGLYVPDLLVEYENEMLSNGDTPALCYDTVKTTIDMQFFNNNDLEELPACKLKIDGDDLFVNIMDFKGKKRRCHKRKKRTMPLT